MSELELKFNFLPEQARVYNSYLMCSNTLHTGHDGQEDGGAQEDRPAGAPLLLLLPAVSSEFLLLPLLAGPRPPGGEDRRARLARGLAPDDKYWAVRWTSLSTWATSPPSCVHWTPADWRRSSPRRVCQPGENICSGGGGWVILPNLSVSQERGEEPQQGAGAGDVVLDRLEQLSLRDQQSLDTKPVVIQYISFSTQTM